VEGSVYQYDGLSRRRGNLIKLSSLSDGKARQESQASNDLQIGLVIVSSLFLDISLLGHYSKT